MKILLRHWTHTEVIPDELSRLPPIQRAGSIRQTWVGFIPPPTSSLIYTNLMRGLGSSFRKAQVLPDGFSIQKPGLGINVSKSSRPRYHG
jgi:hypothetical protein